MQAVKNIFEFLLLFNDQSEVAQKNIVKEFEQDCKQKTTCNIKKLCLESYFSYLKRLPSKQKSSFSFSSSYPPHMGWLSGDQVVARAEHCHHHSPGLAPLLAL